MSPSISAVLSADGSIQNHTAFNIYSICYLKVYLVSLQSKYIILDFSTLLSYTLQVYLIQGLFCIGFILSRVYSIYGLSCLRFTLSWVCPLQRLFLSRVYPVQSLFCLGFVCGLSCLEFVQGFSCLGFIQSRVYPVQGLSSLGFVNLGLFCLGFVQSRVCPGFVQFRVCPSRIFPSTPNNNPSTDLACYLRTSTRPTPFWFIQHGKTQRTTA